MVESTGSFALRNSKEKKNGFIAVGNIFNACRESVIFQKPAFSHTGSMTSHRSFVIFLHGTNGPSLLIRFSTRFRCRRSFAPLSILLHHLYSYTNSSNLGSSLLSSLSYHSYSTFHIAASPFHRQSTNEANEWL